MCFCIRFSPPLFGRSVLFPFYYSRLRSGEQRGKGETKGERCRLNAKKITSQPTNLARVQFPGNLQGGGYIHSIRDKSSKVKSDTEKRLVCNHQRSENKKSRGRRNTKAGRIRREYLSLSFRYQYSISCARCQSFPWLPVLRT